MASCEAGQGWIVIIQRSSRSKCQKPARYAANSGNTPFRSDPISFPRKGAIVMAWAVRRHVDLTDYKTSLSHHGRQISESESEAQGTATGESQQRDAEERATGISQEGGAEKDVGDAKKYGFSVPACQAEASA